MGTPVCFKSVALGVLFFITILVLSQETYRGTEDTSPSLAFSITKHYSTTEKKKIEEKRCTDFGKDVIAKLKASETTRDAFFVEISEFLSEEFSLEIFDIVINDEDQVCIHYMRHLEPKHPKPNEKTSVTRLV